MVGYRFNTIGVSDAISMGTDGMSFSLQSRDLIADSIETVRRRSWVRAMHWHEVNGLPQSVMSIHPIWRVGWVTLHGQSGDFVCLEP